MSEHSKTSLLAMSSIMLRSVEQSKINDLSQPAHLFAETIYTKAQESGIKPAELSYAMCEILSALAPKSFQDDIKTLGVVTLAAIVAKSIPQN